MRTTAEINSDANRVLAEIKTPGTDKARVRGLQRAYAKLCREYERSARAAWAQAPLAPAA